MRGLRENKEDGRLMIVFKRLLRTLESNTELYRGIRTLYYLVLESGLQWTSKGSSLRRLLMTSKSNTELSSDIL